MSLTIVTTHIMRHLTFLMLVGLLKHVGAEVLDISFSIYLFAYSITVSNRSFSSLFLLLMNVSFVL